MNFENANFELNILFRARVFIENGNTFEKAETKR